jgi:hypothetical protein
MLALRYVAVVAIVVWIGGLIALGAVAAPAVFDVAAGRQIADVGPRPRRFGVRAAIGAVMLAAAAYSGIVVSGQIARLQQSIGVAPSSLPESDPRRAQFGRLHALSTALQLLPLAGGLALIYWELKE